MAAAWVERPPRRRARASSPKALAILAAIGAVPTSVLLAIAFWPSGELSSYQAAPGCVAIPTAPTSACTLTLPAYVIDVWHTYGRGGDHYHFDLGIDGARTSTEIDAFLVWFPRFKIGETLQAEVWNGRVTRLTGSGTSFVTRDSPLSRQQDFERAAGYSVILWLPFLLAVTEPLRRRLPPRSG